VIVLSTIGLAQCSLIAGESSRSVVIRCIRPFRRRRPLALSARKLNLSCTAWTCRLQR